MTVYNEWPIDRLVEKHMVEAVSPDERGVISNQILQRVHTGSPLSALEPLMNAGTEKSLRTMAFVLSELGLRSIEAMPWLDELLDADSEWVRHHAVVAVQHSGSLEHPLTTAKAVGKLYDARAVRLAALRFAAHGSLRQIRTAADSVPDSLSDALMWLVADPSDDGEIMLESTDIGVAMVGLAGLHRGGHSLQGLSLNLTAELAEAAEWIRRISLPAGSRDALHRIQRQSEEG